jgi:serine/threonine-protein kinase RsbW
MTTLQPHTVRLEIGSRVEMIDVVQVLLTRLALSVGFDEDTMHYICVAMRESVSNAIRHGNHFDADKRVDIVIRLENDAIAISVRDEGEGFNPTALRDPRADENLLRADGRGVFFMRAFMDDVQFSFPEPRGTMVTMVKRLGSPPIHMPGGRP